MESQEGPSPPAHGQEDNLLPQPPKRLMELWEAYEMLFTTVKKFVDKYTPCHIVWIRPEKGYSSMHLKLIARKAALHLTSRQKAEKVETITVELDEEGREGARVMYVKSTGILWLFWDLIMWYKLGLRKKYCSRRFERREGFIVERLTTCITTWDLGKIC